MLIKYVLELIERTLEYGTLDPDSRADLEAALEHCKSLFDRGSNE